MTKQRKILLVDDDVGHRMYHGRHCLIKSRNMASVKMAVAIA